MDPPDKAILVQGPGAAAVASTGGFYAAAAAGAAAAGAGKAVATTCVKGGRDAAIALETQRESVLAAVTRYSTLYTASLRLRLFRLFFGVFCSLWLPLLLLLLLLLPCLPRIHFRSYLSPISHLCRPDLMHGANVEDYNHTSIPLEVQTARVKEQEQQGNLRRQNDIEGKKEEQGMEKRRLQVVVESQRGHISSTKIETQIPQPNPYAHP